MTATEKAKETRAKNLEARTALYREEAEAKRAARLALQRVFEAPDATAEQIISAATLLEKLSNRY